jgi:hypothetical protein
MKKRLFYLLTLFLVLCSWSTKSLSTQKWEIGKIPTKEEVGAKMLPATIALVKAPFKTIKFEKPKFPADTVKVSLSIDKINTQIIQKAIDELSGKGGGTVIIPDGKWLTGRIELKSNINLHLSSGATLAFSGEIKDFLPVVFTRIEGIEVMSLGACIYANGANNIAITGNGKLIGPAKGSIRDSILTKDVIENVIDYKTSVSDRIVDGKKQPWIFPPMFISPINCKKVYIEGLSLENTAFWNIVPIYCDNVIIRGVTVNSVGIPRGDGIDIDSSTNILIEYCTLSCGDDCFTIKSGRAEDGLRVNKPTENVVVRYCLALEGHGGITCGSETAGMIRNLYTHDCVFIKSGSGIRFKTRRPRGGGGENLFFERIRLVDSGDALKWDMLGASMHVGGLANRFPAPPINALTPHYSDIHVKDIIVEKSKNFVHLIGLPEIPVTDLKIENAIVNCDKIIFAQDVKNASFTNMTITSKDSTLNFDEAQNISFTNVNFINEKEISLIVKGNTSDAISVKSCAGIKNTTWTKDSKKKKL